MARARLTAAATDTLSDWENPRMGMAKRASARASASSDTPRLSLPNTSATGPEKSSSESPTEPSPSQVTWIA